MVQAERRASTSQARRARPEDRSRARETLTEAFRDDPLMMRTLGPADGTPAEALSCLRSFQEVLLDICLDHGQVWVSRECEAVACWTTPDNDNAREAFAQAGSTLEGLGGRDPALQAAADRFYDGQRPDRPVWFLAAVATVPGRQRQGLGTEVLMPGLEQAASSSTDAYLETSNPANVPFYRRLGFTVVAQEAAAPGVALTAMRRAHDA